MFENTSFIKADIPFVREHDREKSPCVMFRRKFEIEEFKTAKVYVCGLGYGYYYINGKKITLDLFTAPVSDYNKTLWYNAYDVTEFLRVGENIFTVICGNGYYNETFKTAWNHNEAQWRDNPKFILNLEIDGNTMLVSDDTWKCTAKTPIIFNHLRSGEHFDSRLYDPKFNQIDFDDSNWSYAIPDATAPKGVFRECLCEPIRECAEYKTIDIIQTGPKKYVFDIGQNISGYIRLKVKQQSGDLLVIRYAETVNCDYAIQYNGMINFFTESEFMTDKFICNGEEFTWSPMFTYHGFRYIEIEGIENPTPETVTGIFVHQDVKQISEFECSDATLNKLFEIGRMATYSNLFYMPTDCPTREKLGWTNDAQASAEQMLTNFDTVEFFKKWYTDILDSMRDDGALPGIVPTSGWGYEWGNGPVSEGILFEIPYRIYLHTGDNSLLIESLPYFERYFEFYESKKDAAGLTDYGLDDWASPTHFSSHAAIESMGKLINLVFMYKFLNIAHIAAQFTDNADLQEKYNLEINKAINLFEDQYMNANGTCKINEQTTVAMAIYVKGVSESLKAQLKQLIEDSDFHHNCGMAGLPYLYTALNMCGLAEYAYKIITAKGYPSYTRWLECGATTLWETWQPSNSKNHHMYSDFMSWIMKTLVGINITSPGYEKVEIKPEFIQSLDFCRGYIDSQRGRLSVEWKRDNDTIVLDITIPENITAIYEGNVLNSGRNVLVHNKHV